jgi:hypothetical protein
MQAVIDCIPTSFTPVFKFLICLLCGGCCLSGILSIVGLLLLYHKVINTKEFDNYEKIVTFIHDHFKIFVFVWVFMLVASMAWHWFHRKPKPKSNEDYIKA